jgi:hypothetical protein
MNKRANFKEELRSLVSRKFLQSHATMNKPIGDHELERSRKQDSRSPAIGEGQYHTAKKPIEKEGKSASVDLREIKDKKVEMISEMAEIRALLQSDDLHTEGKASLTTRIFTFLYKHHSDLFGFKEIIDHLYGLVYITTSVEQREKTSVPFAPINIFRSDISNVLRRQVNFGNIGSIGSNHIRTKFALNEDSMPTDKRSFTRNGHQGPSGKSLSNGLHAYTLENNKLKKNETNVGSKPNSSMTLVPHFTKKLGRTAENKKYKSFLLAQFPNTLNIKLNNRKDDVSSTNILTSNQKEANEDSSDRRNLGFKDGLIPMARRSLPKVPAGRSFVEIHADDPADGEIQKRFLESGPFVNYIDDSKGALIIKDLYSDLQVKHASLRVAHEELKSCCDELKSQVTSHADRMAHLSYNSKSKQAEVLAENIRFLKKGNFELVRELLAKNFELISTKGQLKAAHGTSQETLLLAEKERRQRENAVVTAKLNISKFEKLSVRFQDLEDLYGDLKFRAKAREGLVSQMLEKLGELLQCEFFEKRPLENMQKEAESLYNKLQIFYEVEEGISRSRKTSFETRMDLANTSNFNSQRSRFSEKPAKEDGRLQQQQTVDSPNGRLKRSVLNADLGSRSNLSKFPDKRTAKVRLGEAVTKISKNRNNHQSQAELLPASPRCQNRDLLRLIETFSHSITAMDNLVKSWKNRILPETVVPI